MRCALLVVLVAVGCGGNTNILPDAAADAAPDSSPPGTPDYYGEPCTTPSTLGTVAMCRDELAFPKAYCTPEGACRPFCGSVSVSGGGFRTCKDVRGVETYAFPSSSARVCYCTPPM